MNDVRLVFTPNTVHVFDACDSASWRHKFASLDAGIEAEHVDIPADKLGEALTGARDMYPNLDIQDHRN